MSEIDSSSQSLSEAGENLHEDENNLSNYELSTVLDSLSCGIAIMDADLHVQFVNQSMVKIWGEEITQERLERKLCHLKNNEFDEEAA